MNEEFQKEQLNDEELLRYSRQIFLPEVDIEGQIKLNQAHLVIVGVGGLGSLTAPLLSASGIGKLTLVDFDIVDISNLPRQIFYREMDAGKLKVDCLADYIHAQNSHVKLEKVTDRLSQERFQELFEHADLVLDGTDNFSTRHMINRACFATKTPLLSAAVTQFSGQVILFDFQPLAPCYECLYVDNASEEENNCSESGVMGPAASLLASLQALEAQKFILGMPVACQNTLLSLEMKSMALHQAKLNHDNECLVCGKSV